MNFHRLVSKLPRYSVVILLFLTLFSSVVPTLGPCSAGAQEDEPPVTQSYYLTRIVENNDPLNVEWIEAWVTESNHPSSQFREIVIAQSQSDTQRNVTGICEYARLSLTEPAIHLISTQNDGQHELMESQENTTTWENLRYRGLLQGFALSSLNAACSDRARDALTGAITCEFEDAQVDLPGHSSSIIDGSRVMSSTDEVLLQAKYTAESSRATINTLYNTFMPEPESIITDSRHVQLYCMDAPLPLPPGSTMVQYMDRARVILSHPNDVSLANLQAEHAQFFSAFGTYEYVDTTVPLQLTYTHRLDDSTCRIILRYLPAMPPGADSFEIEVERPYLQEDYVEQMDPMDGVTAAGVKNEANTEIGTVLDRIAAYTTSYGSQQWTLRPEMSVYSPSDSDPQQALLVFERDNNQVYIFIEREDDISSFVTIHTRTSVFCGPTFDIDGAP